MGFIEIFNKIDKLATDEKGVVTLNPIHYATMKKYILDNELKLDLESKLVKDIEDKEDKNDNIVLEDIGLFMSNIVKEVEEGAKEPMRGYLELKRIEKGCKNYLAMLSDEAYNDFENWDKNNLPYGFTGIIQNKLTIKYEDNVEYKELKGKLKELEDVMKNVVKQNEKGQTINDSEGNVIDCPNYSYKASLVVKGGINK